MLFHRCQAQNSFEVCFTTIFLLTSAVDARFRRVVTSGTETRIASNRVNTQLLRLSAICNVGGTFIDIYNNNSTRCLSNKNIVGVMTRKIAGGLTFTYTFEINSLSNGQSIKKFEADISVRSL
jgi:hypothetical protein